MQTSLNTQAAPLLTITGLQPLRRRCNARANRSIDPLTLADLDFGLFKSLCKRGLSRELVCSVLSLSDEDFAFLDELANL